MSWQLVLAHVLLPSLVALVAAVGAWRCWRLLRYAPDPRLLRLLWFYGLFAASLVLLAVWTGRIAAEVGDAMGASAPGGFTEWRGRLHVAFEGAHRVDALLLAHHALMLASLGVAVRAFGPGRRQGAAVATGVVAILAPFVVVALAVEAALTLYLAVRAILNRVERRTPGSLQVAAGFFLFFVGHLTFFLFHHPGSARPPVGEVFALVGVALLVQLLPRPSA